MPPCSRPASDSSPQTREVDSARTCLGPWQLHSRNARRVQESLWPFACRTCLHCGGREHIHSMSRLTSSFGPSHKTVGPHRLTIENGRRCRQMSGSHRAADPSTNGDDPSIAGSAKAVGMGCIGEAIRGSQPRASAFCSYVVVKPADCLRSSCRFCDQL